MPRPHLFLNRPRPAWHFLILGMALGLVILAALEIAAPWDTPSRPTSRTPSQAQHRQAIDAGWIEGTDGYYRFIYGADAY